MAWIAFFVLVIAQENVSVLSNSMEGRPSGPAIYNSERWVELEHSHEPTFSGTAHKPMPPVSASWKDPATEIFVGLVHYRDRRCSTTLANLFEKAEFPDRVHVGELLLIYSVF